MMILVMVLPLQTQLVLAGTLGAMLDATFVLMSLPMMALAKENGKGLCVKGESCTTGFIFFLAYLSHVVGLSVIFGAISTGNVSTTAWMQHLLATFVSFFLLELF